MADKLLDNGTLLTLGLVGVVAAVGAMRKRGSATTIEPKSPDERAGMYELVAKTQTRALWKKTYGKPLWMITDYEGNATLPYGQQDDYPTVFTTLTRAMKVWNTLSSGGAVDVTNAEALRGLGFNGQGRGSRATLDERVADLQFDMTTLFGARETKRPSELKRMRDRVLTENADLLHRIQEQKARGIDTRLLVRDLLARIR